MSVVVVVVMTQPSKPPSLGDQISEAVRQILKPGGITVGSGVAFWQLIFNDSFSKAVVSFLIGAGTSYGARMLKPIHDETLKTASQVGEAIGGVGEAFGQVTQRAITRASGFEKRYLLCQASDCESVRAEGMQQREGIFEPLLKDVFVELQVDSSARLPGLNQRALAQVDITDIRNQTIWDFLVDSQREKTLRQLAILAWGGFGKTTLLKHVAYRYGVGDLPSDTSQFLPTLVPMLIVLRKYRDVFSQTDPPNLATFIVEHHIPDLPEAHRLQPIPLGWAEESLKKGRALVMFDGFDEIPKDERPGVAKWINVQMRLYQKTRFMVTSRPKAYREQDNADRLKLSTLIWVQPLEDAQRRKFVESWYLAQERLRARRDTPEVRKVAARRASDLIAQISAESELRDLAKNPLLLNMISTFHRLYPGAALPKRKVDLYEEICALQLRARPRDRRLETVLLEIDSEPILGKVAFYMMQQTLKRIEESALLRELKISLAEQDEVVDAAVLLRDVVRISELILQQEGEYEFAHLSFQEYLAASYLAENPEKREILLFQRYLTHDWWKSTILLYASKAKKPANLIRELMRQGRKDLAYECLQQTTKRIGEPLRAELEALGVVSQVQDARYRDLEKHLRNGRWKEADKETYRLMITEVGKEEGLFFSTEDLLNFPCQPLRIIDRLWVKHSNGKFGFSVQKTMYLECGGVPDGRYYYKDAYFLLCSANGWKIKGQKLGVKFNLASPRGHLPVLGHYRGDYFSLLTFTHFLNILFFRIQTCES